MVLRLPGSAGGSAASIFAVAAIPVVAGIGAAVDYANAYEQRSIVQASLDSAFPINKAVRPWLKEANPKWAWEEVKMP